MTASGVLDAGELCEVVAQIDQRTKHWRQKAQLLLIIGRWGDEHEIGFRALRERTGLSNDLLERLLGELVTAGVLRVVELGSGSRSTTWTVRSAIESWRGVPWLRDVYAVRFFVFHEEHGRNAAHRRRSDSAHKSERQPKRRSDSHTKPERQKTRRSDSPGKSERPDSPAFRSGGVSGALSGLGSQEVVPPPGGGDNSAPPPGGAGGGSVPGWGRLKGAVVHAAAGPRKFLNGEPARLLAELADEVGVDQLLAWLPSAPVDLGVPRLVEWLADQRDQPDPELLAALDARTRAPEPPALVEPDPGARPALVEWQPRAEEAAPKELAATAAARARAALRRDQTEVPSTTAEEAATC